MTVTVRRRAEGETSHRTCIVQPDVSGATETFFRQQAERLPGPVAVVHGFPPSIDGRPFWSRSAPARAARKIRRLLTGMNHQDEVTAGFVAVFRHLRPSVILAQYGPTGVSVLGACRALQIPLVVHFHGFDASRYDVLEEHRLTYPQLFRDAAAIVVVSRPMAARLISLGADPAKVHRNPCGVDIQAFRDGAPGSSAPVLLAVGRLIEKKAPQLTIRAFAAAQADVPDARLRIIGDGPLWQSCHDLVGQLALTQAVTFLGAQPPAVVRQEMTRVRAFVQHSVVAASGDSEGLPVSIMEAGASGLPVISTRHAGIPEAVLDGETGILVDERDVDGMAQAMIALLGDRQLAARMGQKARDHVAMHFAMDDSIGRLSYILHTGAAAGGRNAGKALAVCVEGT